MFPYNLQNYKPKKDPEEAIPDRIIRKAIAAGGKCISKDGKVTYKETERGIEQAFAPDFPSWWYDPKATMPNDVIWFEKK